MKDHNTQAGASLQYAFKGSYDLRQQSIGMLLSIDISASLGLVVVYAAIQAAIIKSMPTTTTPVLTFLRKLISFNLDYMRLL